MPMLEFAARYRYASGFELDAAFLASDGVTALVGPSGSGKSTILHLAAGLLTPTSGRIVLGARPLYDSAAGIDVAPHLRRLGVVFQDRRLFPHLSVAANLRYGRRRTPPEERRIEVDEVVEVLELGPLVDRRTRQLSGGERQRVALGRALLMSPPLLLLDEPLAALDDALKARVMTFLEASLSRWRIPALLVSHSAHEIERLADVVISLESGRIAGVNERARAVNAAAGER